MTHSVSSDGSSNSLTAKLPRQQNRTRLVNVGGSFVNKFGGIEYFLSEKEKDGSYLDLTKVMDDVFVMNEQNWKDASKLFNFHKKDKKVGINSRADWIHHFFWIKQERALKNEQIGKVMKNLEKSIFRTLIKNNLWNDFVELLLIIVKFWIWKSKSSGNFISLDTFILFYASVSWDNVLSKLIPEYCVPALALMYQNDDLLDKTPFRNITHMMKLVWMYSNVFLNCCGMEAEYDDDKDIMFFGKILLESQSFHYTEEWDAIFHYAKFGAIKFDSKIPKSRLVRLLSQHPDIQRYYSAVIRVAYEQVKNGYDRMDPSAANNLFDASIIAKRPRLTNTWNPQPWPQTEQSTKVKHVYDLEYLTNSSCYAFMTEQEQARTRRFLKYHIRGANVGCKLHWYPAAYIQSTGLLEWAKMTAWNKFSFNIMDSNLRIIVAALCAIWGWRCKIPYGKEVIAILHGINREQFYKFVKWGKDSHLKIFLDPLLVVRFGVLHDWIQCMLVNSTKIPAMAHPAPAFVADWNIALMYVIRNWEVFMTFSLSLCYLMKWYYSKSGRYSLLNKSLYSIKNFNTLLKESFPTAPKGQSFLDNFRAWNKQQQHIRFKNKDLLTIEITQLYKNNYNNDYNDKTHYDTAAAMFEEQERTVSEEHDEKKPYDGASDINTNDAADAMKLLVSSSRPSNPTDDTMSKWEGATDVSFPGVADSDISAIHIRQGALTLASPSPTAPRSTRRNITSNNSDIKPPPMAPMTSQRLSPPLRSAGTSIPSSSGRLSPPPQTQSSLVKRSSPPPAIAPLIAPHSILADNSDALSEWQGSVTSEFTEWDLESKVADDSVRQPPKAQSATTHSPQTLTKMLTKVNGNKNAQKRQVNLPYLHCDHKGVHARQIHPPPFSPQIPPEWGKSEVNFYHATKTSTLWLYQRPFWIPKKAFQHNRSIQHKHEWVCGLDETNTWNSECGDSLNEIDYLMYLSNVDKPITIVESGILKRGGYAFAEFLNKTRSCCTDYINAFFPSLASAHILHSYETDLKMELLWVHHITLSEINEFMMMNGPSSIGDVGEIKQCQGLMARALCVHLQFIKLLHVCIHLCFLIPTFIAVRTVIVFYRSKQYNKSNTCNHISNFINI